MNSQAGNEQKEFVTPSIEWEDFYDDSAVMKQFCMEYEEVILKKSSSKQRLGLTLTYTPSEADGNMDIFVSEIEKGSIAAQNGRICLGDLLVKVQDKVVANRTELMHWLNSDTLVVKLLIGRPHTENGCEDNNLLPIEHFHKSSRPNRSNKEKSRRRDHSIGAFEHKQHKIKGDYISKSESNSPLISPRRSRREPHQSCPQSKINNMAEASNAVVRTKSVNAAMKKSNELYKSRVSFRGFQPEHFMPFSSFQNKAEEMTGQQIENEIEAANEAAQELLRQFDCDVVNALINLENDIANDLFDSQTSSSSAYNTGESNRTSPVLQEISPINISPKHSVDNEVKIADNNSSGQHVSDIENDLVESPMNELKRRLFDTGPGQCYGDVMYTNRENLEHTMKVQQKLFLHQRLVRQMKEAASSKNPIKSIIPEASPSPPLHRPIEDDNKETKYHLGQYEAVEKNSEDSSTIVEDNAELEKPSFHSLNVNERVRLRNKILQERAKDIAMLRSLVTTDEESAAESQLGKYIPKRYRKRQLQQAQELKRRHQETLLKAREQLQLLQMHNLKLLELNKRRNRRNKNPDFSVIQELLSRGCNLTGGSQILSVTTV